MECFILISHAHSLLLPVFLSSRLLYLPQAGWLAHLVTPSPWLHLTLALLFRGRARNYQSCVCTDFLFCNYLSFVSFILLLRTYKKNYRSIEVISPVTVKGQTENKWVRCKSASQVDRALNQYQLISTSNALAAVANLLSTFKAPVELPHHICVLSKMWACFLQFFLAVCCPAYKQCGGHVCFGWQIQSVLVSADGSIHIAFAFPNNAIKSHQKTRCPTDVLFVLL